MDRHQITVVIEELALGSRLDRDGLNHNDDSLMELAARVAATGNSGLAERIKSHAMRVNSLWLSIVKEKVNATEGARDAG